MNRTEIKCLALIVVIFIAACVETDIYLPAFPDMIAYFATSEEAIQSILTWNFIGICLSGPFYGPISDALGRKKPLMAALSLFLAGSILTVLAQNLDQMLWGRLLQGLGSGGCFTLGTAIIFDAFAAHKAINALNQVNAIIPCIMAGAPMLGGYLNAVYGFRSNFLAIAFFVFISFVICLFFFDETLPVEKRTPLQTKKILGDFSQALTSIPFWQMTLIVSLLFTAYISFLSISAVLFVIEFGVSKHVYPIYQAAILGGWLLGSLLCTKAIDTLGIPYVKKSGMALVLIGGLGFAATAWASPQNALLYTLFMTVYSFGANWIQGLYFPEGMEMLSHIKGVAASILTSARLLITSVIVGLASQFYDGTIYPLAAVIVGVVVVIVPTIMLYEKQLRGMDRAVEGSNIPASLH